MKKYISIFLIAIVVITGVLSAVPKTNANPSAVDIKSWADVQGLTNPYAIASSSVNYLVAGSATSTSFIVSMDTVDQADINVYFVGSTTSSILNFQLDFSDDYACNVSGNTCNWYREDANSLSGSLVTHSVATFHQWSPASAATSTKNLTVSSTGVRFMRVGFAAQGANGEIWAQVAGKKQKGSI